MANAGLVLPATLIEAINEAAWIDIDYTDSDRAQVAETVLAGRRLIVRRIRLVGRQAQLFCDCATTRSSPTGPATPSSSTPTTAATPWSSSRSATSKRAPG